MSFASFRQMPESLLLFVGTSSTDPSTRRGDGPLSGCFQEN